MIKSEILILILSLSVSLFSQDENRKLSDLDYFKYVLPSALQEHTGLKILGGGFILSSAALLLDHSVSEYVSDKAIMPDRVAWVGDHYIKDRWVVGVGLLSWGFYAKRENNYFSSLRYLAASEFFVGAITQGIKVGIDRKRPNGNKYSYPSGHASISFTTATVIYHWFGLKISIPAYTIATLTALSRINDEKHYLSDVILGSTLGIAIPTMLYHAENTRLKLEITPNNTLSLSYMF